jgi:hypothetical protein
MKNISIIIIAFLFATSCSKDVDERMVPEFEPVSLDSTGGTWKTVHLASSSDITISVPEEVSSTAYKAELDQILFQDSQCLEEQRRYQME